MITHINNPLAYLKNGYEIANSSCLYRITNGALLYKTQYKDWSPVEPEVKANGILSGLFVLDPNGWYLPSTDFSSRMELWDYLKKSPENRVVSPYGYEIWYESSDTSHENRVVSPHGYEIWYQPSVTFMVQKHTHSKSGKEYSLKDYWSYSKKIPDDIRMLMEYQKDT